MLKTVFRRRLVDLFKRKSLSSSQPDSETKIKALEAELGRCREQLRRRTDELRRHREVHDVITSSPFLRDQLRARQRLVAAEENPEQKRRVDWSAESRQFALTLYERSHTTYS